MDTGNGNVPDESTILLFHHLLERQQLADSILATVNIILTDKGLMLKASTAVDATLIAEPNSTKNQDKERDPEIYQTKKGNNYHFGMKTHIGVDADSCLMHSVIGTAANVHNVTQAKDLYRVKSEKSTKTAKSLGSSPCDPASASNCVAAENDSIDREF